MKEEVSPKIYAIHKPVGPSSFDIIRVMKKRLPRPFGKIGHFGTLDPFASGLLLVGTGGAARLQSYVHKYTSKTYLADGLWGEKTSTGDYEGEVLSSSSLSLPDFSKLKEGLSHFIGEYSQIPPMFSAVKKDGVALYKRARQGEVVERKPVVRRIHELNLVEAQGERVQFEARVSTGTYIRTLFEDFCESLGGVGHLRGLKRTKIGEVVCPEDQIFNELEGEDFSKFEVGVGDLLPFESLDLSEKELQKVRHGQKLPPRGRKQQMTLGVYEGSLACLFEEDQRSLSPKLVFS